MIKYSLRCGEGHEFEAWFRNSLAYGEQEASGALSCPLCGSSRVEKAIMAPRVARSRGSGAPDALPPDAADRSQPSSSASGLSGASLSGANPSGAEGATTVMTAPPSSHVEAAELRRALRALRRQVEENCDYVGPRFAEEARLIHQGEAEARGIYGEASENEARELNEEGIEIARVPWLPPSDA